MSRALRAELRKLRTLRITLGLLGIALGYVLLNVIAVLALQGAEGSPADITTAEGLDLVLGLGASAYLFSFVIGVLASTGEYRHGTIVATFLAQPRRAIVIAAKVLASVIAGLAYGVVAVALTFAVALPWLGFLDHAPLEASRIVAVASGTIAAIALFAGLGAALGAVTATSEDVLPAWGGGLLLVAYTVVLAAAAVVMTDRRDIG